MNKIKQEREESPNGFRRKIQKEREGDGNRERQMGRWIDRADRQKQRAQ
jgi:hypothetical protein